MQPYWSARAKVLSFKIKMAVSKLANMVIYGLGDWIYRYGEEKINMQLKAAEKVRTENRKAQKDAQYDSL